MDTLAPPTAPHLYRIMNGVLTLEVTKGHLKWTVADLARSSGVSRSLIYYHFGRGKRAVFDDCFARLAAEFYGLSSALPASKTLAEFVEELDETRVWLQEFPALTVFYLKFRSGKHPIASKFKNLEKQFQSRLRTFFPFLDATEVAALHGVLHGIVSIPFATRASVRVSAEWLWKLRR